MHGFWGRNGLIIEGLLCLYMHSYILHVPSSSPTLPPIVLSPTLLPNRELTLIVLELKSRDVQHWDGGSTEDQTDRRSNCSSHRHDNRCCGRSRKHLFPTLNSLRKLCSDCFCAVWGVGRFPMAWSGNFLVIKDEWGIMWDTLTVWYSDRPRVILLLS